MSRPYFRHQSGRMFDNAFLEACSRVHPRTPFLFYIPLTSALFTWALYSGTTTLVRMAIFLPVGFLTWVGMEYCIHRYFFHWEGNGPFTRWLHEITHGYHHKYPDDEDRLVMPLGASIPMATLIAGILWLVGSLEWTVPYFRESCGATSGTTCCTGPRTTARRARRGARRCGRTTWRTTSPRRTATSASATAGWTCWWAAVAAVSPGAPRRSWACRGPRPEHGRARGCTAAEPEGAPAGYAPGWRPGLIHPALFGRAALNQDNP
jgi:hypothetical protein